MSLFDLKIVGLLGILTTFVNFATCSAADKSVSAPPLTTVGQKLEIRYSSQLKLLQAEINKSLPKIDQQKIIALEKHRNALKEAEVKSIQVEKLVGEIKTAQALVDHAKGKWIGGADKGIKQAESDLQKATTDVERDAAIKSLAKWKADKEAGIKALKERQAVLDKAKINEAKFIQEDKAAKAALAQAQSTEFTAAKALLSAIEPVLTSDKLDASLVQCAVLAESTPRELAAYSQQGKEQEAYVEKLLADKNLMKQMLEAGGAKFKKFGKAMEIYSTIQKASPKSKDGMLQRLALAVSLEHASPIAQSAAVAMKDAPETVDPVKRYLHYEKAYLDGELDPAFKDFSTWEYRMVVDCDAPDEIMAWGREMLRNYRPDHIFNPDYGWRYSATVRTEVSYGSQNVKCDLATLHNYQNIIKDGGVCGRRAFFGRFILQSFGIPTWGVTQHKHAALSHWTPKGWVVNLGAGFDHSWWDKDEAPRSGSDFLLETQAREHTKDYMKVLRSKWISSILSEVPYNDRKKIEGGFWSNIAHYQTVQLASTAVPLGPLGQELAEANESKNKLVSTQPKLNAADYKAAISDNGVLTIPAVAITKPSGHFNIMKSYSGGMQLHMTGAAKGEFMIDAPRAGKYALTMIVVTVHEGQKMLISADNHKLPLEIDVPYTIGEWQQTKPLELTLNAGKNMLQIKLNEGGGGVAIKEFILSPMK